MLGSLLLVISIGDGSHTAVVGTRYILGLNDRSAAAAASSNWSSSFRLVPRRPLATSLAQRTYSILRLTDQSEGGLAAIAWRLLVLSASFSILALTLFVAAVSTCLSFLSALGM